MNGAAGEALLIDILIILVLVLALTALVIFKSALLALAVVLGALIISVAVKMRPTAGKGMKPNWTAKCPKCRNILKTKEIPCDNCGAHAVRLGGKTERKLRCGRCDMAVSNPKCDKCGTTISPKFWR